MTTAEPLRRGTLRIIYAELQRRRTIDDLESIILAARHELEVGVGGVHGSKIEIDPSILAGRNSK